MGRRLQVNTLLLVTGLFVCGSVGGCNSIKGWAEDWKLPFATKTGKKVTEEGEAKGQALPDVGIPGLLLKIDEDVYDPREYPHAAEIAEPLNIEVVREGNAIKLVNLTVTRYENVQLWLNQQYGADLAYVPIGHSEFLDLESFINEHGEPYPVGRFLQPDRDKPLVLADLVMDGKIHKLVVRLHDWKHP